MSGHVSLSLAVFFALLSVFFLCLSVDYIFSDSQDSQSPSNSLADSSFTRISQGSRMSVFLETKTGVMYSVYHIGGKGGMTVMLNSDGSPLLYQDWLNLSGDHNNGFLAESQ